MPSTLSIVAQSIILAAVAGLVWFHLWRRIGVFATPWRQLSKITTVLIILGQGVNITIQVLWKIGVIDMGR